MRRNSFCRVLTFVSALFLAFPNLIHAEIPELKEGMTQGDFALWMVQAIGALQKLPPGATAEEAIAFLGGEPDPRSGQPASGLAMGMGIIPEGGWQKDEPMTKELLAGLLEDPEEGANLSWEELVEKVQARIQKLFDERRLGTFRAMSSGTPSLPAG